MSKTSYYYFSEQPYIGYDPALQEQHPSLRLTLPNTHFDPVLGSQLYETTPTDPMTLSLAATMLVIAALAAHVVPLRRATGIQPNLTLRGE